MKTVIIIANSVWNVSHFRINLLKALSGNTIRLIIAAPFDGSERALIRQGFKCHNLHMNRRSTNPLLELMLFLRVFRFLKKIRPDAILSFTIKPNLYAALASRLLGIPLIPNITGLGALFIRKTFLTRVIIIIFRLALSNVFLIFFQNYDDKYLFIRNKIVNEKISRRIPGSGIDINQLHPLPNSESSFIQFILITRMLWDKGVKEYIQAAEKMRIINKNAVFMLLGPFDNGNPQAISKKHLVELINNDNVVYLGETNDVRPFIASSDCVVLPSYREGLPRTLLEAAAMGKPIITTDVPGCRDVVEDGVNGFLCKVKDPDDLAEKMEKMIKLTPEQRSAMGMRGREKVVREFDEKIVIKAYTDALDELFAERVNK